MSLRRKIYEVIEVADKDDRDSLIYDRFMLVCIAASIVPLCFKETNALFIWLPRATVSVLDTAQRSRCSSWTICCAGGRRT